MGAFQDFIRGFAQSSNQFPAAMAERYRREQAAKAAERQASLEEQQQVQQRLATILAGLPHGLEPSADGSSLLGQYFQQPTEPSLGTDEAGAPIQGPLNAAPWASAFAPKPQPQQRYMVSSDGVFDTQTGTMVVKRDSPERWQLTEGVDPRTGAPKKVRVNVATGETQDLKDILPTPPSKERSVGIDNRAFMARVEAIKNAVGKDYTKEAAKDRIRSLAAGYDVTPDDIETQVASVDKLPDKLPITGIERTDFRKATLIETVGKDLLSKLDNPKVIAGLGRVKGPIASAVKYLSGTSPEVIPEDLIAFWKQFGISKDNIMRAWSGAQTSDKEFDRISKILGNTWDSPGALVISVREMVRNSRMTQQAIRETAGRQLTGDWGQTDVGGYDLKSDTEIRRLAVDGDEKAVAEFKKRGL